MAAAPQTAEDLLGLIERSGIIPLDKVKQRLKGQKAPTAALPLAKWLVGAGLLTKYQAEQFLQGRSRGFFLGNYRVLERLGGGATAGVFLCEHKLMHHRVAVKVLDQKLIHDDANTLLRFRREARAAAALSHPNIVRTIDLDEDAGRHFLVMEYVEGVTLDKWMKDNPAAPASAFVNFIAQTAMGLHHIHESGLIHRDLKPGNLLLDKQGTVKILDLGLAKFTDDCNDALSRMQGANIMGTVDFMSPEQADGSTDLDIRADIYSLGASLYYLLTGGHSPFPMGTLGAKMIAIQFQDPAPIREFRPDVDAQLVKIVEKMMAKIRDERFQTPAELIGALEKWKSAPAKKNATPAAKPPRREKVIEELPLAEEYDESAPTPNKKASNRALMWGLRTVAFLLVVGALVLWKPWHVGSKANADTANARLVK